MSDYTKLPIVTIIGQTNVGKSSLYNAILAQHAAIVAYEPGTTRDNVYSIVNDTKKYWLIDTAGLKNPEDDFELSIQDQILEASTVADLIVVVVQANTIVDDHDRKLAKLAHKTNKPLILVINKIDQAKDINPEITKYQKLGIKTIITTSVKQNRGIGDLKNTINKLLPTRKSNLILDQTIKIALIGRPNVGKSSLFNSLAKKQQALVSAKSGTTRDINRVMIKYKEQQFELLDTAGMRRPGKVEKGIEYFSVLKTFVAIQQADICLIVISADEPAVSYDQRIIGLVKEAGKGLAIIVNKWDLLEDKLPKDKDKFLKQFSANYDFISWAPMLLTSATSDSNINKIFELALTIHNNSQQKFKTPSLNKVLTKAIIEHPPAGLGNHNPKLNYIVQEKDNPIMSFKIFGSQTKQIHWSYKRYLENSLRQEFELVGIPIQIWFIEKHQAHKHGDINKLTPKKGYVTHGLVTKKTPS